MFLKIQIEFLKIEFLKPILNKYEKKQGEKGFL